MILSVPMESMARAYERQHAEAATRIEQALFKGILEIAEDAIISVDSDQRVLLFNHGAEKVFGYTASEVIGEPLDLLMPQRFVEAHRGYIDEFAESPDVARPMGQRREVFGRRKDGGEFAAEASISKLDLGDELVFTVILRDITERKRAAEELQQVTQESRCREAELRQLIDFVPQHIIVLGPDGHRLYANKVSLEYSGHTLEEFRAADYHSVVHPDDLDPIRSEAQQVAAGTPFEMEGRMLGKDGRYRWFLLRYNPLRGEDGHIVRWYVTGTDIDDRKQAEERVHRENIALRDEVDKTSMFEEIVGASPALQAVLSRVAKVAPTESTVLISGETGTGKELIARAIHKRSVRAAHAFVSVNCAGVPQSLIASELFGHEKGAFTGAVQRRLGRFELAEGGTLFLDEVGELPAETQIALLRVLQEREFERVGGNKVVRADVRLITATNRDLQAAVDAGAFRSDLFYRLNVFPIEMPALRERRDDIPTLVEYFIARYASRVGKKISGIDNKTLELLRSYPWPGNIRELQNVIERSVILCETKTFSIDENWLSSQSPTPPPVSPALNHRLASNQRTLIEAALAEAKGRVSGPSGAAARLGIPPSTLDSKIKALQIDKQRFKRV
jgi:PAS domain S-box-containing protein